MPRPSISVIIPAYNAQDTISAALQALKHQSFSGALEIIVVDDGSTDRTAEMVRAFQSVRYIYQANAGPASARNRGVQESSGDIIFFTDADCRPEPDWIEKMLAGFTAEDIGVVAGSYGIANPASWLARVIHGEIIFRHSRLMPDFPRAFGSYNVSFRRKVFEEAGGFDVSYRNASGEDNELSYKILHHGYRIRFLKDALVDHVHQENPLRYLKEQYRHGFWRVKIYLGHPVMAGGDDYTFWKDILEVPLVFLQIALIFLPFIWITLVFAFIMFELVFGYYIIGASLDALWAGGIMWLRAFARVSGFCAGGFNFLIYNIFK